MTLIYTLERQACDLNWYPMETFEDRELAEKELANLNDLLINGKPYATLRITPTET